MSEHFIKNIEIKNYKCFDGFKAEGFQRVNLIGGKNNVGKTAFMEACYLNIHPNISYSLADIITTRYQIDLYSQLMKEVGVSYVFKFLKDKALNFIENEITTNLGRKIIQYEEQELNVQVKNSIVFIDTVKSSKSSLEKYYSKIIEKKLEQEIDTLINEFDSSLESFRIITSEPKCSLKSDGKFRNLNEFGDGLHKYITFICLLLGSRNSIILIDEIDVGIHYTQFDKLWHIVLTISKQQNIQIFATTHSKECIESYARVSKELEDKEISFIKLTKLKDNSIMAGVRDYEMFQYSIEDGHEVRGW
jgi:AAA15 family ATPase/GTPase